MGSTAAAASTLAAKLKQLLVSRERRTLSGCAARSRTWCG